MKTIETLAVNKLDENAPRDVAPPYLHVVLVTVEGSEDREARAPLSFVALNYEAAIRSLPSDAVPFGYRCGYPGGFGVCATRSFESEEEGAIYTLSLQEVRGTELFDEADYREVSDREADTSRD